MNIDKICAAIRDAFSEADIADVRVLDDKDTCATVSITIYYYFTDSEYPGTYRTVHKDLFVDNDGTVIAI